MVHDHCPTAVLGRFGTFSEKKDGSVSPEPTPLGWHAAAGASLTSLVSNDTLVSLTAGGTLRPELFRPERFGIPESDPRPTGLSNRYALKMVVYEVWLGVCVSEFVVGGSYSKIS